VGTWDWELGIDSLERESRREMVEAAFRGILRDPESVGGIKGLRRMVRLAPALVGTSGSR
jgi:hypothetical protein